MTSFIEMAATIMTFHLLGRYLEALAKGRASQAIRRLLTLGAKTARVERGGEEVEVPVKELEPGDIMVVRQFGTSTCEGDFFHLVDRSSGIRGPTCVFGEFVPYRKPAGDEG